jgi:spore maturation protein SpmA
VDLQPDLDSAENGIDAAHSGISVSVTVLEGGRGLEKFLQGGQAAAGASGRMGIVLPEVHFVKLRAITAAAFELAEFAVTLALGLVGIMALWLGLMKIAEEAGLIHIVVKGVRPFMRWLFPELPKDHPAMGMISLNLAANVLGLGNAATPLGIKAMEELQKLNPEKDTATNSMVMFLALNTSSVQLLPPVTLVAIMGMRVNELMVAITLTTIFSTAAAISAAKLYARRYPPVVSDSGEIIAVGIDSDGAVALDTASAEGSSGSAAGTQGASQNRKAGGTASDDQENTSSK